MFVEKRKAGISDKKIKNILFFHEEYIFLDGYLYRFFVLSESGLNDFNVDSFLFFRKWTYFLFYMYSIFLNIWTRFCQI